MKIQFLFSLNNQNWLQFCNLQQSAKKTSHPSSVVLCDVSLSDAVSNPNIWTILRQKHYTTVSCRITSHHGVTTTTKCFWKFARTITTAVAILICPLLGPRGRQQHRSTLSLQWTVLILNLQLISVAVCVLIYFPTAAENLRAFFSFCWIPGVVSITKVA